MSTNFETNIGKISFKLLCKHFPKMNKMFKLFNKNTVKISYRCRVTWASLFQHITKLQHRTELSFKEMFRNRTKSFNHRRKQNETELSKYIWTLKHQNKNSTIK